MVRFVETEEILNNTNLSKSQTVLFITRSTDARNQYVDWKNYNETKFSKHQIKETDMRTKTASFTSPQYIDLTTGQYCVLISSPSFENFSGIILSSEYDEKTGLYTYQCQDWSRKHMTKTNTQTVDCPIHSIVRLALTNGYVGFNPTQETLEKWGAHLSGLRPRSDYNQVDWGSLVNYNPMSQTQSMIIRGKPWMEVLRDVVYGTGAYIDIYFNDNGIIQVEPYHKLDFENTGVHIDHREVSEVKMKFDATNVITGAQVRNTNNLGDIGTKYFNDLLETFFGTMRTTVDNIIENKTNSGTGGSSGTVTASNGNPYGTKAKKIWINSDNGSGGMKNSIATILRQKGWDVHVGGTCSNCHYSDYFNVTSDYQVYATLYNGFCAGTVREAYSDYIQNTLKKKGVVLVIMWDSSDWTSGMKPYRYGDFSGYNAGRAWDDNFSSSDPSINNVAGWLKSKGAIYCANPTAEGIVDQFLKGGYFKSVGQ